MLRLRFQILFAVSCLHMNCCLGLVTVTTNAFCPGNRLCSCLRAAVSEQNGMQEHEGASGCEIDWVTELACKTGCKCRLQM